MENTEIKLRCKDLGVSNWGFLLNDGLEFHVWGFYVVKPKYIYKYIYIYIYIYFN